MSENTPEEWRAVVGYEGLYEVSDQGRVRGVDRTLSDGRSWKGKLKATWRVAPGYVNITLCKGGLRKKTGVHRLVCHAFNGEPTEDKPLVRHLDGDHGNNVPGNLKWGDGSENQRDRIRHGRNHESNKTHCPYQHPYSESNTYRQPITGNRVCKLCKKRLNDKHNAIAKANRLERRKPNG